jgi:hypothetical protein
MAGGLSKLLKINLTINLAIMLEDVPVASAYSVHYNLVR